jgi:1,4-dihydroxy-6-naphthoate synthase
MPTIHFSPCPNDTFIFDALVNKKIDTEGIDFESVLKDVQTLNEDAIRGVADITKISFGVLPEIIHHYKLLDSGAALGSGVGPLLISSKKDSVAVDTSVIAIPGKHTTAHQLFSLAYPDANEKVFLRYDEIESFVADGKGLGVIIHENRFTYEVKGLHKITDLGEFWEHKTGVPVPLGGIVIKRSFDDSFQKKIGNLIRKSIEYAYGQYPLLNDFIISNAQEMSEEVMRKHIELYVNNYSVSLGETGRQAIRKLFENHSMNQFSDQEIFVDK